MNRGNSYLFLGRLSEALADANQAIKLEPQSYQGYSIRGTIKGIQKDIKGAEVDRKIVTDLSA